MSDQNEIFKGQCLRHEKNEGRLEHLESKIGILCEWRIGVDRVFGDIKTRIAIIEDTNIRQGKDLNQREIEFSDHIKFKDQAVKEQNEKWASIERRVSAVELDFVKKITEAAKQTQDHVDKKFFRVGVGIFLILVSAVVNAWISWPK